MSLLNKLRNKSFWMLDHLRGKQLKRDLNNIENILKIDSFSKLKEKNESHLRKLLDTAVRSTEYYSKYKSFTNLDDFPVINKLIIKENFKAINILPTNSKKLTKVSSSGSTGVPFEIYQTERKRQRNKADVLYFSKMAGYSIGNKLLFIRLWMKKYRKSYLFKKLYNIIEIDVESDLKNQNKLKSIISNIQKTKEPTSFIGYPSGFDIICNYLEKNQYKPLNCNVKSIIATSEALYKNTKNKMEYYFNTPVVSRYSNEENGILAQQMINEEIFTINWASFYIEILDLKEDKPAKHGEIGRIVITDLYNLATPLIRYDTGDLGKFCNYEDDKVPKFDLITGRVKDTLYSTKGEIVNPFIFYNGLTKYPELKQFQIVQKGKKEYIFKINIDYLFQRENELLSYYKTYLGDDADIKFEYVDEIPLLNSGKRRIIVNQYKP